MSDFAAALQMKGKRLADVTFHLRSVPEWVSAPILSFPFPRRPPPGFYPVFPLSLSR